ncbi:MAG: glycosyltransferase family 2 protein [Planctomycetota bacterium]
MRVTCLINHYNYGEFVGEALASVVGQTRALDEVILVDDGSQEPHLAQVRAAVAGLPGVRLIEKPNEGQLSCFQVGLEASTGDVVFFLDADDRWRPGYVEAVLALLERRPDIGFVATNNTDFFTDGTARVEARASRDLGYSVVLCLARGGAWIGAPTSCLAMRREVLEQIFPVPNPRAWRVCADEALVYGSSMVGARKYFLGEPLVEYRVHDNNRFFGRKDSPERAYSRRIEGRRLTEHLRLRLSLPATLADLAHYEFRTLEAPTREDYRRYQSSVLSASIPLRRKLRVLFALFRAYHFGRNQR